MPRSLNCAVHVFGTQEKLSPIKIRPQTLLGERDISNIDTLTQSVAENEEEEEEEQEEQEQVEISVHQPLEL